MPAGVALACVTAAAWLATASGVEGLGGDWYGVNTEAVADVRSAMEGMLRPEEREVVLGEAVVQIVTAPELGVGAMQEFEGRHLGENLTLGLLSLRDAHFALGE